MANLDAARERVPGGGRVRGVSRTIHASWQRARKLGVRPDGTLAPVPLAERDVERHRREHPLAAVWPALRESLRRATSGTGQMLLVSDAEGRLLWAQGDRDILRDAERVHMTPGALWSESTVGTTAVGMALALGRPFAVDGPEHYLAIARRFSCCAAPIRDPHGRLLGTVDLTCAADSENALRLSLVTTAAKMAESLLLAERLRHHARLREKFADRLTRRVGAHGAIVTTEGSVVHDGPSGWLPSRLPAPPREGPVILPDGRHAVIESLEADRYFLVVAQDRREPDAVLRFTGLGRDRAVVRVGGTEHRLTARHSEIVAVLLGRAERGLTAEELAREIYGAAGRAGSIRVELSRLRPLLGHRLASDPYRLLGPCEADFTAPGAARHTLLPRSTAPGVAGLRG
ncbi:GAF domain-containing protein [Yinghuangia sp. ASG 101]|uniref:GAF domain-containing protein n=1 Tax=Yinghuangia sp. ASG 101 TaxID=2896848 RepID=UPI001E55DF7D|nr:helix-turn-helix domain-containing protein [Yinghuangia sp. ASG 101]UGQ09680.1 GAF domain-containing protein [Yinghuangia sp. ASG 101]